MLEELGTMLKDFLESLKSIGSIGRAKVTITES